MSDPNEPRRMRPEQLTALDVSPVTGCGCLKAVCSVVAAELSVSPIMCRCCRWRPAAYALHSFVGRDGFGRIELRRGCGRPELVDQHCE